MGATDTSATDRLRRLQRSDAARAGWRSARDAMAWLAHLLFLPVGAWLAVLLFGDDPSSVDDSLIGLALAALFVLGWPILGLVAAGAPALPAATALIPPIVLFALPWRDLHSAAIPTVGWLVVHAVALLWTVGRTRAASPRRPSRSGGRRESGR